MKIRNQMERLFPVVALRSRVTVAFAAALLLATVGVFGLTAGSADAASSATDTAGKTGGEAVSSGTDAAEPKNGTDEDSSVPVPSEALLAWSEKTDCKTCHTTENDSFSNEVCQASIHAAFELACVDCHVDDTLVDVHSSLAESAKLPKKLKKTEVPSAVCQSCHETKALAEKTEDCDVLTDSEGTVVNPHDLPDVKEHETIDCGSCHRLHSDKGVASTAQSVCLDCHHEDVYECGTCHS